ncbi:MAG: TAXI family TRAP transporter solute-binding subunit [Alphaproteobacteria bacterium]
MKGRTAGSDATRWFPPFRPRGLCRLAAALLVLAIGSGFVARAGAEDASFFRIATGSSDSPLFAIGGLLASAISKPPGSRACSAGGSCGVPGLIAVAVSTEGSMANVEMVNGDKLESGLMSADVAYWAYRGEGPFQGRGKFRNLTAIASLYPETIHLVVARKAKIRDVKGLTGKRVSLGIERSSGAGTAREILQVYGLAPSKAKLRYDAPKQAAELLRKGQIDAFFVTAAGRSEIIGDLAASTEIEILPLAGEQARTLIGRLPYLSMTRIPAGTYKGIGETPTLAVPTQWIVSEKVPEELVYNITGALWHATTRRLLDSRTPEGKQIKPEAALDGLGVPLHPGAARYYREARMLK